MATRKTAISIGHRVRDIATGFEGIATTRVDFLTGNVQFGVQPPIDKKEPGKLPDPIGIDVAQLDFVDVGIAAVVTPAPTDMFALGSKVEDIISKFQGIATRRTTFLNGCVYYNVQAEKDKENTSKEDFVEYKRLKVIGKGVTAVLAAKAVAVTEEPPGGPMTRIQRRG